MYLRTLGELSIGKTGFRKGKPLLLLTYLTVEGRQNRRQLAELFWFGAADHMNSLAKAISQLRSLGPGVIQADESNAWSLIQSDVSELLTCLKQGDVQRAIALYQAPFLKNFYLPHCGEELEEWICVTREFIAERLQDALVTLAEQSARSGQLAEATIYAEQAYQLAGAPAAEPELLRRLYTLLSPTSSALIKALRHEAESYGLSFHSTPPLTTAARAEPRLLNNLPQRGTSYIGRELEIAELNSLMTNAACRLLTLCGQGGSGKTRLALQVAFQQLKRGKFNDGVYFIALESVGDSERIPSVIAEALGVQTGQQAPINQLKEVLRDKAALLVFDNFEHLTDGAPLLSELLGACPNLHCLVTSREALHLEEEWLFQLEGLQYPDTSVTRPDDALEFDAVKLFVDRAQRSHKDFALTAPELTALIQLCQLVQGSPLALELAAWWARAMSVNDIVQELRKGLDLLSVPTQNLPERQQSIRATFEYSWALLSPKKREVLCRLSVFQGGFDREAAQQVAGATIPNLVTLLDKSLLLRSNGRYDMHPLLKQYLAEKLALSPDDARLTRNRHAAYFTELLTCCAQALRDNASRQALDIFTTEHANILSAWDMVQTHEDYTQWLTATQTLVNLYFLKGSSDEVGTLFSRSVARLRAVYRAATEQKRLLGYLLLYQAASCFYMGDHLTTRNLLEESLQLLTPLQELPAIIRGLNLLGGVEKYAGQYETAREYYQQALGLAEQTHESCIMYLNNLGHIALLLGQYDMASAYYQRSLAASQSEGKAVSQVSALQNLGLVHMNLGNLAEARTLMTQSLTLAQEHAFEGQLPYSFAALSELAITERDYRQAQDYCLRGLHYTRKQADKLQEGTLLVKLARVAVALADTEAQQHLLNSLTLLQKIGDVPGILDALVVVAQLAHDTDPDLCHKVARLVAGHRATSFKSQQQAKMLLGNSEWETETSNDDLTALVTSLLT